MNLFVKKYYTLLLLIICCFLIFGLTYFASVETKNGDFTYSLLVSQALIQQQTVRLDTYKDKVDQNRSFDHDYRIEKVNEHYYYFLPLGPSVLSVPVVGIANLVGKDMTVQEQEYVLLKLMAALSCVLIFVIIYKICTCYLDPISSLAIALVSVLGTALVSSLGAALSSMNFAVIFITLSLLLIARYDSGRAKAINPYGLGLLLFLAFWCRPTAAPFIVTVFIYVFFIDRATFFRLAVTALFPFLIFLGWSWFTYGQLLPTFSTPDKLIATSTFWVALYGNAFSPARGLFVFAPFFAWVVIGAVYFFYALKRNSLFWFSLFWFSLYYILVSRYPHWWDGHNYGPRILTDGIPALIILSILFWKEILQRASTKTKAFFAGIYMILGVLAIFINTYQGLYNPYTYLWLKNPNIDRYPEYLFDWKYPQFLATEESLHRRRLEHQQKSLTPYSLGDTLTYDSSDAVFWNWYGPEIQWRWTSGSSSRIVFKLGRGVVDPQKLYTVEILAGSAHSQAIEVNLNNNLLGTLHLDTFSGTIPDSKILTFAGTFLKEDELNTLDFYMPNMPASLKSAEKDTTGMAFVFFRIYPFTDDKAGVHYFDGKFFRSGFSDVEKEWRWTEDTEAVVSYMATEINPEQTYMLAITSGALEIQKVTVLLNGVNIGDLTFEGFEPETHGLTFKGNLLKADDVEEIHLLIPNASIPPGDSRRLGLAFVSLEIYPVE